MAQGNNLQVNVVANVRAAQKQINALVNQPYNLNLNAKGGGISAPLGRIKGQLGEFEKSLEASNARVIAFGASASAIYAINTALRESVRAAVEVEKALKDINVILNLSEKNLGEFGKGLFDIAKSTGNSFSTVATAATELSRQGLGVNETLKRTQDALILTRLSGLDAASSVEAITASLNGFQKAALTSTEIINKLAAVDASFAVSSADLAEAIKRVGSSAEDAGVSFDELLAIVTSTQQITARGGAVIGNSFKTIFTRLQRTETLDALEQLGIQTKTAEGSIRPLIQVLADLSKKYDTLGDVQKAAVAEQVGGVFQINILKAALGDLSKEYSIFSNALNISTGATDEAIRRNEELNTTLASLLNKTIANLTAAGAKIGELSFAPALKKVFGGLNTILENFTGGDSEDVGNKIGEGLLKGLGNFLSGPGLIIGAKILFGIFERLIVFSADAIKSLSGLNAQGVQQAQIQQQIFSILQKNPQIIQQIVSGQTTLQGVQNAILTTIQAQTLQMQQQVTLSKSLAASLAAAGVSISKSGPTSGRLQITSGGFVPNLFNEEESSARKMGAVNPKAQISAGTIDGKKFIKNSKELEIVGIGKNGDSAVIPTYGSIGNKRQKELYEKMQFLGFIPNFAPKGKGRDPMQAGKSIGNEARKQGVEDIDEYLNSFKARKLSEEEKSAARAAYLQSKKLKNYDYYNIPASNVGVISASEGGRDFVEYNSDIDKSPLKLRFTGLSNFVPRALQGGRGLDKFEDEIREEIGPAIIKIAEKLRMGKTGDFPDKDKLAAFMKSDQSAYPQLAGRIFETVVTSAINKSLETPTNKGNTTWDYPKGSFQDVDMVKAIFGDAAGQFLLDKDYLDAKRTPIGARNSATNSSLKSKFFNTPSFQDEINKARQQRDKILKTAHGFVPNFANQFEKSPIKFTSAGLSPDQAYGANRFGKFKDAPDWKRKEYSEFALDPVLGGKLIDKRWGRTPTREQRLKRIEKSRENREAFRLIQGLPISPSVLGTLNFYKNKKSYQYDSTGKMQIYKSADGNISLHEVRSHEYSGNESNGISVENGKLVLEDYNPNSDKKLSFNPEFKKLISQAGSAVGLGVISRSELTKKLNTSNIAKIRDNPLYQSEGYIPNFASISNNPIKKLGEKTGVITGDVLKGKEYQNVLSYLAKTFKPIQTILGPPGSGKTTLAMSLGGEIVKSIKDLSKYDNYILDRAMLTFPKDPVASKDLDTIYNKAAKGGGLNIITGSRDTIRSLREKRTAKGDKFIPDRKNLLSGSGGVGSFTKGIRDFSSRYEGASLSRIIKKENSYDLKSISNFNKGFIPNFAGIKDAMQTEKKMGGQPALDFEEGIGLYVRDRKTQPNFSAVKRDHPEGISTAIKNSRIAQEALARGFIPNFIAPGQLNPVTGLPAPRIPTSAGAAPTAPAPIQTQPAQKAMGDYTSKLLVASLGFSTLSGVIQSFTKDSESNFAKMSSSVLQGVGTFASIAAIIPGPIGLVAGALVGGYQAISGIMEVMRDQTGPIKQGLEQAKEGLSKFNDASQSYATTFEKLEAAYADTSKSPEESAKTIMKLEKDLAAAVSQLPSAYRDQLKSAENLTEIQEIIAKAQAENAKKIKQGESALGLAGQIKEKGTKGAFDEGQAGKAVENIFAGINPEKQAQFFEKYQKGEVGGLKTQKLADGSEILVGGTEDIINAFRELGASEEELAQISRMGTQPLTQLQRELKNQTDATIKNNEETKQAVEEAKKRLEASAAEREAKRKEAEAARKAAEAAAISAEANRQAAISELKLANVRRSNLSKIANEAAASELQTAQPFTTAKGMAVGQAGIETARRFSTAETQRTEARTGAISKISSDFSNSIQKAIDEGLKAGTDVTQLQTAKGRVAGIVREGGSPEEITKKLENLGKELNLNELLSLQSESKATLESMAADIALVDEELKTGNVIAEKQLAEQIKQIRNQERVKALGGMQGFLDPESLKEPIEKLLGGFQKAQTGQKFGLEMTAARGFAEAGMAALELTGGAGSPEVNAALKESVVPQQTKFVKQTFEDLATQARATGTPEGEKLAKVFETQAADAANIAAAQFDAAFQKEQLPQNVAKILDQVTKIASGDTQKNAVEQGIKDAEKLGTGPAGAINTGRSITSGLSGPPTTATTISGKPLFAEKEQAVTAATGIKPSAPTTAGTTQAQVIAARREFSPDINQPLGIGAKGALTSAEAEKYKAANMAEQDRLRQQAASLSVKAVKGDSTAKAELEQTKDKISKLSERYKGAEGVAQTLAYSERPVQAGAESMAQKLGRTRAEMQFGDVNRERREKEAADRFYGPEKKDQETQKTTTSKGELNVSFTPISVDIKGAVETANDELSQKMTDAIKQAVEQIAPGIISKIYGPPRDSAKT